MRTYVTVGSHDLDGHVYLRASVGFLLLSSGIVFEASTLKPILSEHYQVADFAIST